MHIANNFYLVVCSSKARIVSSKLTLTPTEIGYRPCKTKAPTLAINKAEIAISIAKSLPKLNWMTADVSAIIAKINGNFPVTFLLFRIDI